MQQTISYRSVVTTSVEDWHYTEWHLCTADMHWTLQPISHNTNTTIFFGFSSPSIFNVNITFICVKKSTSEIDEWNSFQVGRTFSQLLGASLVQSRLEYANSIMYGMSASNMHKLQSAQTAQNSLTRVVLPSLRHLSASDLVTSTGFLFTTEHSKIATLTYETLATCQPSYLYNLLQLHQPSRALCSSTQHLLQVAYVYRFR